MKKMPISLLVAAFLNLLIGIVLIIFKIPYGVIPILLFIMLFIPRAWARGMAIGICALVVFGSLIWIFVMIAIGETVGIILIHASVALFTGLVYVSFLFTLFSDKVRPFYIRTMFSVDKNDLGTDGWMCPKCNAKNKHSLFCWNCDYSKEDFLAAKNKKSKTPQKAVKEKTEILNKPKKDTSATPEKDEDSSGTDKIKKFKEKQQNNPEEESDAQKE